MRQVRTSLPATAMLFCFLQMCSSASPSHADNNWPTFRGADRTAVAPDTDLLEQWPESGPKLVWETEGVGRGYAGVAISGGKLFTLGDELSIKNDKDEYLTCFDVAGGKHLWSAKTGPAWTDGKPTWQSSRSTPTVDQDRVYVITPAGKLFCFSTEGKEKWQIDLKAEFKGKKAEQLSLIHI